ncbi:MAG: FumA C-terminus/TtdB family hydratase beta subunit [Myxococcota bacterium]|nr:FumA C-terminus/TtdB family hydratase beta subunit [Myxococcota bacterium]
MIHIDVPTSQEIIRTLKVGDDVELSGTLVTARDAAHKYMVEHWPTWIAPLLADGAIYHCGPVMQKKREAWTVVAAGPTTSIREEPYEAQVMTHYKVRWIIGKGGMGDATLAACQKVGAVYLHAVGGAAVQLADSVKKVREVHLLDELGVPEAFWVLEVAGFRGVVTMDASGHSLHQEIQAKSDEVRRDLLGLK